MADRSRAADYFSYFAEISESESPLYSSLARQIAVDDDLLALCDEMLDRQPPANVLFASAHFLILRGADHPVRGYYHTVGGDRDLDGNEFATFKDFCREHHDELLPLLRKGLVQTNEVRRATFLMPAFAWIAAQEGRPLATLEVGTAAGFLTLWDRFRYSYEDVDAVGDSDLTLTCELRGAVPSLDIPRRAWSAGIDLEPIHVDDADQADWLRSLVWPDQTERMRRLEAAIDIARADLPVLVAGDGIDIVGQVAADAPDDALLVVHHSFAFNQVSPEDRLRFDQALMELSEVRDTYLVAVEWTGPDDRPELRAGKASTSEVPRKTLARIHHHGAWLDWVA